MAKQYVKTKDSGTVYYRQGDTLRPISSIQDFAALNGGSQDVNGLADTVDSLPTYNTIGSALTSSDISNINKGLTYNPLSTEGQQANLASAQAYYQPSKDAFASLINNKIDANNLDFNSTKDRLKTTMDSTIAGVGQDLSNRGFLRSGEQITRSTQAGDAYTADVNSADIQRAIAQADLLLQEATNNADLDKAAQTDAAAKTASTNTANENSAQYNQQSAAAAAQAAQDDKDNAVKQQLAQLSLQQARVSAAAGATKTPDPGYKITQNKNEDGDPAGLSFYDGKGVPITAYQYLSGYSSSGNVSLSDIRSLLTRSNDAGDTQIIKDIDSGVPLTELQKRYPYVFTANG